MQSLTLAYRDPDRTPVIFAMRDMAKRYYDLEVVISRIRDGAEYEPALFPTPEAIANTYEIATLEYPNCTGLNPVTLWDLHWVKELDDEGFIEKLPERLSR